jgi:hypothetical protein
MCNLENTASIILYPNLVTWVPIGFSILGQLCDIIDPEYPIDLVCLEVLILEAIEIVPKPSSRITIHTIYFFPTYGQCKLAPLLGISINLTLFQKSTINQLVSMYNPKWLMNFKITIDKQYHTAAENITKQLNDKERLSAALENNAIRLSVLRCMKK